jgi:primosomal protein N' (replication factor Y)
MERVTLFADIIVPLAVPNKFTYRVPAEMNDQVSPGKRALVQFGKTKIYTGIIHSIHEKAPKDYTAKYIEAILDDEPVVTAIQLKFWDWIAYYYCANPGDVMNAALPSGLKLSSTSNVQLNPDFSFEETEHSFFTEREHALIDALHTANNLSFDDAARILDIKSVQPIVNNLLKKNAVVVYEEIKDKYKPKLLSFYKLSAELQNEKKLSETLDLLEKKAFKQAEALLYFLQLSKTGEMTGEWIKRSDLVKKCEVTALSALVKKGILIEEEFEIGRLNFEKGSGSNKSLSASQKKALEEIKEHFSGNKTVLLQGVTGSGKTEIYIELVKEEIAKGKEVLFLVPEIALTTQLITRLRAVFGEIVGVYHSRFSENERVEIWNNVLGNQPQTNTKQGTKNKYSILLGARSSLFLPFNDLGLIIVDEEHDNSFKQHDPAPRYHARDSAMYLATQFRSKVLLGSATPSIESYYNAQQKKYALVTLPKQFVEKGGTEIEVCDTRFFELSNQNKASFTPPLFDAINAALEKKEQVILFQNRRGFAPYTECKQCAHVPQCVNCDVSLIYHKQSEKLQCHYCGYSIPPPKTCSACGSSNLVYKGMGTEKIEEDAELLFPKAKIARMDLDSTRSKHAYKQLIDDFEGGQIDILIGTQMVTKGLDFNNVAVVGILNADSLLNFPDFRSYEKAFQMITQVRGRAGRGNKIGKVLIQTSHPKHLVINYVCENDLEGLYQIVLDERKQFNYPPFSRLIELNVISKEINEVSHLAQEFLVLLQPHFGANILGPEFPLISRIRNFYYKRLLLKIDKQESPNNVRAKIHEASTELFNKYKKWNFRIQTDVDPV